MTPTIPLPDATRSLSFGMYEESCVNELMLRSAGTTAGDAVAVPPPPPQAIATIPTTPSVGKSLANLIGSVSYLSHLLPSSRAFRGESAPANRLYSAAPLAGPPARRRASLTPARL